MPYTLPNGTVLPSVTEILTATQTRQQKQRLAQWQQDNPGLREQYCNRGTATHQAVANYLTQPLPRLPVHPGAIAFGKITERNYYRALYESHLMSVPGKATDYYKSILPWLSEVGHCYWVEHEVDGCNQFLHSSLGYAGRPDIIAEVDGELVLADLKTGDRPYCKTYNGDGAAYAGYMRTSMQLAAYAIAAGETLGITRLHLVILVAQPETLQVLELCSVEADKAEKRWLKRLKQFSKKSGILMT